MDNITSQDNNLYQPQTEIRSNFNYSNPDLSKPKCMGIGCKNLGRIFLKIEFINKVGHFCDTCAEDLLDEKLAVKAGNLSLD
jgi:hypothetical protein